MKTETEATTTVETQETQGTIQVLKPKKAPKKKLEEMDIVELAAEYEAAGKRATALYAKKDKIAQRLVDLVGIGNTVQVREKGFLTVFDPFVDAKTGAPKWQVWAHASVRRWTVDIKEVK